MDGGEDGVGFVGGGGGGEYAVRFVCEAVSPRVALSVLVAVGVFAAVLFGGGQFCSSGFGGCFLGFLLVFEARKPNAGACTLSLASSPRRAALLMDKLLQHPHSPLGIPGRPVSNRVELREAEWLRDWV